MAIGDVVRTQRIDQYHVEIRHPGRDDWNQIHSPAWETTTDHEEARAYAERVEADHPGSEVRIIQTPTVEVTKLATGETEAVELAAKALDH